jgi:hypothetical protein
MYLLIMRVTIKSKEVHGIKSIYFFLSANPSYIKIKIKHYKD